MSLRSILAAFLARFNHPTTEDKTRPPTREGMYTFFMERRKEMPVRIRLIGGELIVTSSDGWAESTPLSDFWRGYEVTSWEVREG